jgi:hypothetical protein
VALVRSDARESIVTASSYSFGNLNQLDGV